MGHLRGIFRGMVGAVPSVDFDRSGLKQYAAAPVHAHDDREFPHLCEYGDCRDGSLRKCNPLICLSSTPTPSSSSTSEDSTRTSSGTESGGSALFPSFMIRRLRHRN